MQLIRSMAFSAAAAIVTGAAMMASHAQRGELVTFPNDYAKGVMYATVDRADLKQVRVLYANSQAAIDAAKAGKPLPDGTVLTMVQYAAATDDKGEPVKAANGRLVRTDKIVGYTVMEKQAGWGKDVPEDIRNGDWQYQAFLPDRTPNPKAQLAGCFKCHKPFDKQDFVFSWDGLRMTAK
ncbi:MAG: cytochrome P460 family protein [Hyphomicrobiales bacterium]|nr:cytochrome P460 family protein [Hyphomicrobiales bacterium]